VSIFIHIFLVGSVKRFFPHESVSAAQGHPRSLILVRIESAYANYSVVITLVLLAPFQRYCTFCSWPHSYSTLILGIFPLHQIAHVGVNLSRYLKLFDALTTTPPPIADTEGAVC